MDRTINERYTCTICKSFYSKAFESVLRHVGMHLFAWLFHVLCELCMRTCIGVVHSSDPNFKLCCGMEAVLC